MAPEILTCPDKTMPQENKDRVDIAYGAKVDVWALGVLAYELLEGHCPFERETRRETYEEILRASPAFPSWMSDDVVSFIRAALKKVRMPSVLYMSNNSCLFCCGSHSYRVVVQGDLFDNSVVTL